MIWAALALWFAPARTAPELMRMVAESGRVIEIGVPESERISPPRGIAPGAPPLLGFREFEGRQRGRYSNLNLVIDDAGH